jgi:hypothetical protein
MNYGTVAMVSAPLAGLVLALIALYRVKVEQRKTSAEAARLESDLNKTVANRRIMLERWADDVQRYHRDIRRYLIELGDAGVIDMGRVDLSRFPPPPLPTINGDGNPS